MTNLFTIFHELRSSLIIKKKLRKRIQAYHLGIRVKDSLKSSIKKRRTILLSKTLHFMIFLKRSQKQSWKLPSCLSKRDFNSLKSKMFLIISIRTCGVKRLTIWNLEFKVAINSSELNNEANRIPVSVFLMGFGV